MSLVCLPLLFLSDSYTLLLCMHDGVSSSGDGYCLPLYALCNGVHDCPYREDEHQCQRPDCRGLYRCRGSTVCLHVTHVCDGWSQCPQHDDENFCNLICPHTCLCQGHSYLCRYNVSLSDHPQLRFLHASGSGIHPADLRSNTLLIYLNLAMCKLTQTGDTWFPNLLTLDLSFNHLQNVDANDMNNLPGVISLSLAGNPFTSPFIKEPQLANLTFPALLTLDLSFVEMRAINPSVLRLFPSMQSLNLSHCHVHHVQGQGFQSLSSLQVLDMRQCPLTSIPKSMFRGLRSLRRVFSDNYKVCCPATLPVGFEVDRCLAPSDEISSCDALLRSDLYRISLAVFATLATAGNVFSLVLRLFVLKGKQTSGYSVFVTHLCVSDFLMGVYLVMIGGADRAYLGTYLWEDTSWKNSMACKMAGFVSLLSSEVSASIICLVTVDRFLAVRFPFHRLHFQRRSAQIVCLMLWTMGTVLAAVPLLPVMSSWRFYSQTGICIPLPVTRQDLPGHGYAFAVMIVLNFVLFLVIAAGQLVIYMAVRSQSIAERDDSDRRSKDLAMAQRLLIVVVSDFLCWFPIGLLGLLASAGTPVPGEINVSIAIFVLPLNSALNPFLYSLNTIQARRARAREQRLIRTLISERATVK